MLKQGRMLLAFFLGLAFGLQGGAVSAAANNGGNARPSPDYNRDRGNSKAGQVNRAPQNNGFGGSGSRPAPSSRPAPAAHHSGRGRAV